MLVNAALAAWQGDLEPAERWFTILGREIGKDDHQLTVGNTPALPGGGIIRGGDPITGLIQMMLLTAGPLYIHLPQACVWIREVNDIFRQDTKARVQSTGAEDLGGLT